MFVHLLIFFKGCKQSYVKKGMLLLYRLFHFVALVESLVLQMYTLFIPMVYLLLIKVLLLSSTQCKRIRSFIHSFRINKVKEIHQSHICK